MRDVVFLGAGASLVGEAGLPLFGDIRAALLDASGALADLPSPSSQVRAVLDWFAPEALLLRFDNAGVDVEEVLVKIFNNCRGRPNVAHLLTAAVATTGGAAWTVNYDTPDAAPTGTSLTVLP